MSLACLVTSHLTSFSIVRSLSPCFETSPSIEIMTFACFPRSAWSSLRIRESANLSVEPLSLASLSHFAAFLSLTGFPYLSQPCWTVY